MRALGEQKVCSNGTADADTNTGSKRRRKETEATLKNSLNNTEYGTHARTAGKHHACSNGRTDTELGGNKGVKSKTALYLKAISVQRKVIRARARPLEMRL